MVLSPVRNDWRCRVLEQSPLILIFMRPKISFLFAHTHTQNTPRPKSKLAGEAAGPRMRREGGQVSADCAAPADWPCGAPKASTTAEGCGRRTVMPTSAAGGRHVQGQGWTWGRGAGCSESHLAVPSMGCLKFLQKIQIQENMQNRWQLNISF